MCGTVRFHCRCRNGICLSYAIILSMPRKFKVVNKRQLPTRVRRKLERTTSLKPKHEDANQALRVGSETTKQ